MEFDTRSFDEITNEPLTELQQLEQLYCEMHKDVYGVKARWYKAESVEHARADLERLGRELEAQIEADRKAQAEAIAAFEELAKSLGGIETAKRAQHQAHNTNGDDEYLEYCMGLPYGFFRARDLRARETSAPILAR